MVAILYVPALRKIFKTDSEAVTKSSEMRILIKISDEKYKLGAGSVHTAR